MKKNNQVNLNWKLTYNLQIKKIKRRKEMKMMMMSLVADKFKEANRNNQEIYNKIMKE